MKFTIDKYRNFQPIRNSINGDIVNVIVININTNILNK